MSAIAVELAILQLQFPRINTGHDENESMEHAEFFAEVFQFPQRNENGFLLFGKLPGRHKRLRKCIDFVTFA